MPFSRQSGYRCRLLFSRNALVGQSSRRLVSRATCSAVIHRKTAVSIKRTSILKTYSALLQCVDPRAGQKANFTTIQASEMARRIAEVRDTCGSAPIVDLSAMD